MTPPAARQPSADTRAALGAQVTAADPTHSVWVSANAGTGKTRVLIDRITRLLLTGTKPGKILCLTFTKAAAAEMANRLSERLGAWTRMAEAELRADLLGLLGQAPEDAQVTRARRLFAEVLDTPGGLKIRTIHSFCESLLGQFPLEAGVAPHFQVIDERTGGELLREARGATLLHAFDGDANLAAALRHLAELTDETGLDDVIRELANNRSRLRDLLRAHGSLAALDAAVRQALGLGPDDTEETILAAASGDDAFDGAALGRACAALDQGTARDKEKAATLRAWIADDPAGRAGGLRGAYAEIFLTKAGEPRAESTLATKGAREADPGVVAILQAEQERLLALGERLKAAATGRATQALLRFAERLLGAYERLKEARALLDYDDLVLKVRHLLGDGGRVSWVHYKLDGGIDHVLVDEAQDTSPEQWDVIAGLAAEFFAGEGSRAVPRTLFAVGDEKQSIYSFQGADPAAFERMHHHFAERARAAGQPWRAVEMPLSFRTVWTVLRAVDAVFTGGAAAGVTFDERPIRHLSFRTGQAGLIEIWPTVKPEDVPDADPWDAPLDAVSARSPQVRLAERIAERIDGWLKAGEVLEPEGRPMRPGDIMILVRRRERFAEEMIRCLKERGIPVAGSDRMVLTDQLAVMDLMALGRFLLLPEDDLTLAEVLKGPLFGLDDDDLFALAWGRDGSLWDSLRRQADERPAWRAARDGLGRLLDRADFMPPFEFFSDVLGPDGGRRKILGRLGVDAGDPLDEFLSLAQLYERDHVPSLQGFLQWLTAGETQIKRDLEQGRGEVRVMTVHGAKGLQGNVVFLPDTCSAPDPRLDARVLWHEGEPTAVLWPAFRANENVACRTLREAVRRRHVEEYGRLLYVAMTRARDRLYVCGWENKRGRGDGCWYDRILDAVKGMGDRAEEVDLGFDAPGWRIADGQTAEADGKAEAGTGLAAAGALPDWARRPPPAEEVPPRPLTPSHPDGEEPPVASPFERDDGTRFKRGRLIHALLQTLPQLPEESRAAAAAAFLARPIHGLDAAAREAIAAETLAVLSQPGFAELFEPTGRAEVPLVGTLGERTISAQVDRLVVTPEAVLVVDFKTNRPPPADPGDVPVIYLRQMAAYRAALRQIYPDRAVRCALLWTDGPRLMALDDAALDAHAP